MILEAVAEGRASSVNDGGKSGVFFRLGHMVMIEASEAPLLSPKEAFKPS